ncbi:hypothetical protein ACHAWT_004501, partial [Skeletonema menzelii]
SSIYEEKAKLEKCSNSTYFIKFHDPPRLTKFVRRLYTMLTQERNKGVIEWRRGLLVLYSMEAFANELLPKYFNTHNFKTFRRQLNYYGFVHVRSHATSGSKSAALWANPELVKNSGSDSISSVLNLRRVEASEASKTPEGRRGRKNEVASSIEVDGLGISVSEIYNAPAPKTSPALFSPPIPASITCEVPSPAQVEQHFEANDGYDSRIDEAAGLLVSILHAHP